MHTLSVSSELNMANFALLSLFTLHTFLVVVVVNSQTTPLATTPPATTSSPVTTPGVTTPPLPPTTPPPPPPSPPPPPTGFITSRPGNGSPVVNTTTGMISGFTEGSVDFYLGIPYAAAPIGNLRFSKPQPHEPWDETYEALEYGKECPSRRITEESDEDCLTLNVFVPSNSRGDTTDNSLPVMVYFHAGGFTGGSSRDFSGDSLAAFGKVVIFTVNYRLGVFGFLSTGDDCSRGNWGLWDQHFAIQWVRDNAERFGGNPGQITIFGSSAGADSALLQALSPVNTNQLFQRVISQSAIQFNFLSNENDFAIEQTMTLAENLGFDLSSNMTVIDFLRNQDPGSLLDGSRGLTFYPVVDGEFMTEAWSFSYPSRIYQYDLLIGVNTGDASALYQRLTNLPTEDESVSYESGIPKDVFFLFADLIMESFCADLDGCDDRDSAIQAAAFEYNDIQGLNNESLNLKRVLEMGFDASYSSFASSLAQKHSNGDSTTYVYEFAYDMAIRNLDMVSPNVVPNPIHGALNQYLEGSDAVQGDINLSNVVGSYWTNFAHSGYVLETNKYDEICNVKFDRGLYPPHCNHAIF